MSAAVQQKPEIKIKLSVVKGPHSGQVYQLNKPSFTIGRGPENDLVLMNDPQISRSHAKVMINDRDLEVVNLSSKNAIFVDGEGVQRWKIVNNSNFTVGDSEFNVEYDLGQAVVSIPTVNVAAVLPLKPKIRAVPPKKEVVAKPKIQQQASNLIPANRNSGPPGLRHQQVMNPQQMMNPQMMQQRMAGAAPTGYQQPRSAPGPENGSLMANSKFKFYLIIAIALIGIFYSFSKPTKNARAKKIASTLKYEDEVNTKMISQKEKDLAADRELRSKEKARSPQAFRIEESFVRGMRDYQLGNYTRAQEFYQLVLNLDPDHALAKRHLYLSKVRFDELIQEKLMLGESYFKKHNFRMCESMYSQVMDMLNGKNNDQKFQLAEKKARECELATEGIR